MMDNFPLYAVLVSFLGMFGIFAAHRRPNVREAVTIVVALAKFGIVAAMVPGVLDGETYVFSAGEFVAGIEFVLDLIVDCRLHRVRNQNRDDIGLRGGLGWRRHLKSVAFGGIP